MTKRDYWSLSEKERANLTREQVEGSADFELMSLGVLAVPPLVLEEEPDVTLPERKPCQPGGSAGSENSKTQFESIGERFTQPPLFGSPKTSCQ